MGKREVQMSKRRKVPPSFYPDFTDADTWKSWDGSPQAEAWASLLERRDEVLLDFAVEIAREHGPEADLAKLLAALWNIGYYYAAYEEVVELLEKRWDELRRRAGF